MSKQAKKSRSQLATDAFDAAIYVAGEATAPDNKKLNALGWGAFQAGCDAVLDAAQKAFISSYDNGDPTICSTFRASSFGSVFDFAFVKHIATSAIVKAWERRDDGIDWYCTCPYESMRALNELKARRAFSVSRKRA